MGNWQEAKDKYAEAKHDWDLIGQQLATLRAQVVHKEGEYNQAGDVLAQAQQDLFEAAKREAYTD